MSKENYILTVGLEVHAELKTRTKMFCDSKNDPDETKPNVNVCPVCMGHPGTLPVINKEAVKHVLRVGMAVGGVLADFTEFDRKNYFYPDIPKGYQLSQYKYPLVSGGVIAGVKLTRVHLEEDTATSQHLASDNLQLAKDSESKVKGQRSDVSLVDFNRAGVPLMELVTEPVIHDAKTAGNFARELQLLLRYLGVSDANMEKGEMRVEANISISDDLSKLGTKVEVKNLNSFRAVERAIEYEFRRHTELLESGEKVTQETRGWDEKKQETCSQRAKEDAHDYRYFPDPDLPKLMISEIPEFAPKVLKKTLPELPWERRKRYKSIYGLKESDIEIYVQDNDRPLPPYSLMVKGVRGFFEDVVSFFPENKKLIQLASNYIVSDLPAIARILLDERAKIQNFTGGLSVGFPDPKNFAKLIQLNFHDKVNSRVAKDILIGMMRSQITDPEEYVIKHNLFQKSDEDELKTVVQTIIDGNGKVVADYKSGKEAALQFLVGQGMKVTKGSANPEMLKSIIKEILSK